VGQQPKVLLKMRALCLLMALVPVEAQKMSCDALSEIESCKDTDEKQSVLLQKTTAVIKDGGALNMEEARTHNDDWTCPDKENGYPAYHCEKDGYTFYQNKSWAGTSAHLYHSVRDTDMCNTLCMKDSLCKGFIFHHEPEEDGNYRCYLVTSQGQGLYYNPCCHVGIPLERSTTTTTTTAKPGVFTISYKKSGFSKPYTYYCIAEINGEYVLENCELAKPEMEWEKMTDGYYVNKVTGKCMSYKKTGYVDSATDGKVVPSTPSELGNPRDECAHFETRGKMLRIGTDFHSETPQCIEIERPDSNSYWYYCNIAVVIDWTDDYNVDESKQWLSTYDYGNKGDNVYRKYWVETEVMASVLQHGSNLGDNDSPEEQDCRLLAKQTCPTAGQVKGTPSANSERHQCWDAVNYPWWKKCRCKLSSQDCGGNTPCLVKILEVVDFDCLQYEMVTDTETIKEGE